MIARLLILLLTLWTLPSRADDGVIRCLRRIDSLQRLHTGTLPGIYPSEIRSETLLYRDRADENIYYNALIDCILRDALPFLNAAEQQIALRMLDRSAACYPYFRNRGGRLSYNFWRTDSMPPFPYGKALTVGHSDPKLPDDLDDTALTLWALGVSRDTALEAHRVMQQFTAGPEKPVRSAFSGFNRFPAYSTWYGKRFPVVFDICVQAKILLFVQYFQLPWTPADSASLDAIVYAIRSGLVADAPAYCAPYYPDASVILYHLGKLRAAGPFAALDREVPYLQEMALSRWRKTTDPFEQVVLYRALTDLGMPAAQLPVLPEPDVQMLESSPLAFFVGNIPSSFRPGMQKLFIANGWLQYRHYCPAYNEAVYLEYLIRLRSG